MLWADGNLSRGLRLSSQSYMLQECPETKCKVIHSFAINTFLKQVTKYWDTNCPHPPSFFPLCFGIKNIAYYIHRKHICYTNGALLQFQILIQSKIQVPPLLLLAWNVWETKHPIPKSFPTYVITEIDILTRFLNIYMQFAKKNSLL